MLEFFWNCLSRSVSGQWLHNNMGSFYVGDTQNKLQVIDLNTSIDARTIRIDTACMELSWRHTGWIFTHVPVHRQWIFSVCTRLLRSSHWFSVYLKNSVLYSVATSYKYDSIYIPRKYPRNFCLINVWLFHKLNQSHINILGICI